MKKIIVFNWKMAPVSLKEAKKIFSLILKTKNSNELIICPPFVYLEPLSKILKPKVHLGSQNLSWKKQGVYTGEISALMLKNLGVKYVIIGHSERRQYLGETDEIINKEIKAALKAGLKVILCVGESKRKMAKNYIKKQLEKDLKNIHHSLIIAYEPIWAIGTGNFCKSEDALEIIKFIKQTLLAKPCTLNPCVLYGGSVDSKNINDYLKHKEIDGVLVGGASVNKKELEKILKNL